MSIRLKIKEIAENLDKFWRFSIRDFVYSNVILHAYDCGFSMEINKEEINLNINEKRYLLKKIRKVITKIGKEEDWNEYFSLSSIQKRRNEPLNHNKLLNSINFNKKEKDED